MLAIVYGLGGAEPLSEQAQMMILRIAGEVRSTLDKITENVGHAERGADLLVRLAQGLPAVEEAKRATAKKPRRPPRKGDNDDDTR